VPAATPAKEYLPAPSVVVVWLAPLMAMFGSTPPLVPSVTDPEIVNVVAVARATVTCKRPLTD
jgi:hypothetical protein